MRLKALLFIFFFTILLNSTLQAMDKETLETVQIIAEMCYRNKVDLKNKTFNLSPEKSREENPFSFAGYDADNLFPIPIWKTTYPNAHERLMEIWDSSGRDRAEIEFAQDSISLFEMIEKLQPNSKKVLLKNLSTYTYSSTKFALNSFLSLASCSCSAISGYLFFNTENQKLKLATAASGLASFIGSLYFAKSAKKLWDNADWWNSCTNFHKAMDLCKNK